MGGEMSEPIKARLIGSQFLEVDDSETRFSTTGPNCIRMAAALLLHQGFAADRPLVITTTIGEAKRVTHD
jgi:hypothetical protein